MTGKMRWSAAKSRAAVELADNATRIENRLSHFPSGRIIGPDCPRCRHQTVSRFRRSDGTYFWGCTQFPKCKGTLPRPNTS
jgi:ssDNA-binding Zn-finger/Zn-ribbon topoisomerase 1